MPSRAVFLPKPDEVSCSEAMRLLRIWLDSRKIQPSNFKLAPKGEAVGFEIAFQNERDAAAFNTDFAWHPPAI